MAIGDPGDELCVGTTDGNTLAFSHLGGELREITLGEGAAIVAGQSYAITVAGSYRSEPPYNGDYASWAYDYPNNNDQYADGNQWFRNPNYYEGDWWDPKRGSDFYFITKAGGVVKDSYTFPPWNYPIYIGYGPELFFQLGQSFLATTTYNITSVVLQLGRYENLSSPGLLTVSIRAIETDAVAPLAGCHMTTVLTGELRGLVYNMEADIEGQGNIAAGLHQSLEFLRAGIINSSSVLSNLTGNHIPLWAAIGGTGVITGELTGNVIPMAGSIHGQSWLGSNLAVWHYIPPPPPEPPGPTYVLMVGEINGQSGISGSLSGTWRLSGTIDGQSVISGWLTKDDMRGTIDGQSTIDGTLSRIRSMSGTIAGQSSISSERLSIEGEVEMWGSIHGQSSISSYLETSTTMRGTIAGQSSLTSFLTVDDIRGVIAGQSWIGSGWTGPGLTVVRRMQGSIHGQSSIGGDTGAPLGLYEPLFMISYGTIEPVFIHSTYLNEELIVTY